MNCKAFLFFFFLHLLVVATHAVLRSPKFVTSSMKERWLHLVSSFWLPLPFLTIRGVDRGEEKAELWFLVTLHSLENAFLSLISRWAYGSYKLENFLIQLMMIAVAVLMSLLNIAGLSKRLRS